MIPPDENICFVRPCLKAVGYYTPRLGTYQFHCWRYYQKREGHFVEVHEPTWTALLVHARNVTEEYIYTVTFLGKDNSGVRWPGRGVAFVEIFLPSVDGVWRARGIRKVIPWDSSSLTMGEYHCPMAAFQESFAWSSSG